MNGWQKVGIQTFEYAEFLSDQKIIVVGDAGQIRLSSDGGVTWRANNQNPEIGFQSVSFIDSLHGLIGASKGQIFGTSDGGLTWTMHGTLATIWLNKILMVTPDTVFACGIAGALFRSIDGGLRWDTLHSKVPYFLRNLYFTSPRNGFAVGDSGTILHTSDAGNSWQLYPRDSNFQLLGIDFLDSLHGMVCGQRGVIYTTSDGGKNWHNNFIDTVHELQLVSISYHSQSHLSATTIGGFFFESNDSGNTWTAILPPKELQDLTITWSGGFRKQRDKGWAVGYSGVILLSSDSGRSWQQSASCPIRAASITDMHFFDSSRGYAVGTHNLVLWTLNAGQTWKSLTQENGFLDLFKIYSPSQDTAWAFGWLGWLNKTTDGWKTVQKPPPPMVSGLHFQNHGVAWLMEPTDIFMVNRNLGYLVGDSLIWKTTDAGATWSVSIWHGYLLPSNYYPNEGSLFHVFFPSADTGFVAGQYTILLDTTSTKVRDYGIIFRTRNGGETWDTLDYGYRNKIYGMYFWNAQNGIIISESGDVLKTSDGGDSWRKAFQIPDMIPGQASLSGINFLTNKVGYITAVPAKIFLTTDGGESWKLDLDLNITSSTQDLFSIGRIIFPDSNTVMIGGYQGMLRKKIDLQKLSVKKTESGSQNPYAWITLKQNPVTTTLSCKLYWFLAQTTSASLKIYNILGMPVQDLSEQLMQLNFSWGADLTANVSGLPSGVYLLVLNASGTIKSQPFIIAK
jgi:photosystem II stability/assembly factor-like uncharacterized protein